MGQDTGLFMVSERRNASDFLKRPDSGPVKNRFSGEYLRNAVFMDNAADQDLPGRADIQNLWIK
jgi:hypothetical protein